MWPCGHQFLGEPSDETENGRGSRSIRPRLRYAWSCGGSLRCWVSGRGAVLGFARIEPPAGLLLDQSSPDGRPCLIEGLVLAFPLTIQYTVSLFNGPPPTICSFENEKEEINAVAKWIAEHLNAAVMPHEIWLFVRSDAQLDRARTAANKASARFKVLDEHVGTAIGYVSIGTMHLVKGLEFRVAVMACDDEIIPLQARIESVGEDSDLKEVYDTERHLLYVACTRARDDLFVTAVAPGSEFLDDLKSNGAGS